MEKSTPHCRLPRVKQLLAAGKVRTTHSARQGASELGLAFPEMLNILLNLTTTDFYKSMTSHTDHTIWQDVYCPVTAYGSIYLKLTVIDDVLIVSFKER